MEEFFEGCTIENAIVGWFREVNREAVLGGGFGSSGGLCRLGNCV
jgi:hypothetical protein